MEVSKHYLATILDIKFKILQNMKSTLKKRKKRKKHYLALIFPHPQYKSPKVYV
jgi:hypothetical protein